MQRRAFIAANGEGEGMSEREQTIIDVDWTMKHGPVRVFDANGEQVQKCVEANLETGECIVFAKGDFNGYRLNEDRTEVVKETVMRPAPLRIEFIGEATP